METNELLEQYIGKDLNQHITEEETDLDEYGKDLGAGAYVSRFNIKVNKLSFINCNLK